MQREGTSGQMPYSLEARGPCCGASLRRRRRRERRRTHCGPVADAGAVAVGRCVGAGAGVVAGVGAPIGAAVGAGRVVRRVPRGGCRAAGVGACRVVRRWPSAASHFAGFMSRLILLALCRVTYYLLVTNTSTAQTTPCGSGARGSSTTCSTSSVLTPLRYGARKNKSRGVERRRQEARARRKGAAKTQQRGSKEGAQP